MTSIQEIEARRDAILEEMRSLRSMRRGTINEQYFNVHRKGKKETIQQGPYYVLSRREGEKTVSKRLTSLSDLEQARREVAVRKKFVALCREFEQLTTRLGELERKEPDIEQEKKRSRSPLNKRRK